MSDTIDLIWAKLPSFYPNYHETSNDSLVSFSSFIPKIIFNHIKPFWEGYVMYNNKRIAVYKIDVIESLLKETYMINLDGIVLTKSVQTFPGSLIINKIINAGEKSNHSVIAKMSHKQRQFLIYTQIKRDLWALFSPSEVTTSNEDFKSGEWTSVRPSKNDKEYDFNLARGLLHYEEFKKNNEGNFVTFHRVANLKDQTNLHDLFKLVIEFKKYGKNTENFVDFDFKTQWNEGFDGNSYEPKGIVKSSV